MKARVQHIGWLWPAQAFCADLILIYPVYAIMMQDAGVTGIELSGLFILWSLAALLFEIPSGVLGDLLNRKLYIGIGAAIKGTAFVVWLLWPTLPGFATGFLLWSLGGAIRSGTAEALLFELLKADGRAVDFSRIYGRGVAAGGLGVVVAMALGGFAAEEGFVLPLLASAAAPLLSTAIIAWLPASVRRQKGAVPVSASDRFTATLRLAIGEFTGGTRRQRRLLLIAVLAVFLVGTPGALEEFVGLVLQETGTLSLAEIGFLYGIAAGALAIGGGLAHFLDSVRLRLLAAIGSAAHLLLIGALLAPAYVMALLFALYFLVLGALSVSLSSAVQHRIEADARATVTSLMKAGLETWGVCLYLLIGLLADTFSWTTAVGAVGVLTMVIAIVFTLAQAGPSALRSRS